jgi:hypothetical protein
MEILGGCLCRATRYRSAAPPIVTRVCWCRVCQYFAAGSGTVNVCFTRSTVTIEGSPRDYRSVADSGNVMHRRFCPVCGTHLFSEAESRLARPAMTIWRSQAPCWACIDAELPITPAQPPPA